MEASIVQQKILLNDTLRNSTMHPGNDYLYRGHQSGGEDDVDYHSNSSLWSNVSTGEPTILPDSLQIPPNLVLKVIFCTICQLVTFFGNVLVLYAYYKTKKLRTYTNYYIVGLAIADLISGGIMPGLENILWYLDTWPFSEGLCAAMQYLVHVFLEATFMMTLVICYDRFRALNMPLKHLKEKTLKHAYIMTSLAYIIPLVIWTPLIIIFPYTGFTTRIRPPSCHGSYAFHPPLLITAMLTLSWIPMAATVILYAFVYSAVIRKGVNKKRGIGEEASSDFKSEKQASVCDRQDSKARARSYLPDDEPTPEAPQTEHPGAEQEPSSGQVFSISGGLSLGLTNLAYEQAADDDDTPESIKPEIARPVSKETTTSVKRPGFSTRSRRSKRETRLASLRATRTLTYILVTTVVTAAPWSVFALWAAINPYNFPISNNEFKFLAWLAHLSSTVNPFCYAASNPLFKGAFLQILRCRRQSASRRSTRRSRGMSQASQNYR